MIFTDDSCTLIYKEAYFSPEKRLPQASTIIAPNLTCTMPFRWSTSKTNNESSISRRKDAVLHTCAVCHGPVSHFFSDSRCPGPGGCLPGGSANPYGLNYAIAPIDFTAPDRIMDNGIWHDCGRYKMWLPVTWPHCFEAMMIWPPEPPPYPAAGGGEKAAEGAAGGSAARAGGKF